MAEDDNTRVVRENYAAVGRGGHCRTPISSPRMLTGTWQGPGPSLTPECVGGGSRSLEFFALLGQMLEFQQIEPQEFIAQGDTVVVLGHERSLVKPTHRIFEQDWYTCPPCVMAGSPNARSTKIPLRRWKHFVALPNSVRFHVMLSAGSPLRAARHSERVHVVDCGSCPQS